MYCLHRVTTQKYRYSRTQNKCNIKTKPDPKLYLVCTLMRPSNQDQGKVLKERPVLTKAGDTQWLSLRSRVKVFQSRTEILYSAFHMLIGKPSGFSLSNHDFFSNSIALPEASLPATNNQVQVSVSSMNEKFQLESHTISKAQRHNIFELFMFWF